MAKYLKINADSYYEEEEYDYDDPHAFHEGWYDIYINGISIVDENSYYDIVVGDDFKREDIIYLVYVVHTSGSSFENITGNHVYINAFKDKDKADELVKMIEKSHKENLYEFEYLTDSGKKMTCYCGYWTGYFERFESVECLEMILE